MANDKRDEDARSARQRTEAEKQDPDAIKRMEEQRRRPDFIQRTRPDDPSEHFGQLTRDNINPDIPSAPPGTGGIVDPRTLGMPQAAGDDQGTPSINEPPGSNVLATADAPPPDTPTPEPTPEPLPSNEEMHAMRRSELDELAAERGVDISNAGNKEDVIDMLRRDARKRK